MSDNNKSVNNSINNNINNGVNIFRLIELINIRMSEIEKKIVAVEELIEKKIGIERDHLLRIRNGEKISPYVIMGGIPYNDLTPEQAYNIYQEGRYNFVLVDVSDAEYKPPSKIEGTIHIPLEELLDRYVEFASKVMPIFFISENGTKSILAAEFMNELGFYNVSNISGGHQFWPGHQQKNPKKLLQVLK
ncbi:MAG: rhodanese-like domain-containing protein [Oligoflexia bacterium]|nr:rhodanese-like domain-containing protein [Oligoflexia bacterium]